MKDSIDVDRLMTSVSRMIYIPGLEADILQMVLVPTENTLDLIEQGVNNAIMLRQFISSVHPICDALTGANASLLVEIRKAIRVRQAVEHR